MEVKLLAHRKISTEHTVCQALVTAQNVGCKKVPGFAGQSPQTEPRAASQKQYCTKLASCLGKQHSINMNF